MAEGEGFVVKIQVYYYAGADIRPQYYQVVQYSVPGLVVSTYYLRTGATFRSGEMRDERS
jgi:hypothetical protein